MAQFVDPEITTIKFNREIERFEANANTYRKKGILCIGQGILSIDLMFCITHLKPQPIAFAVRIDYTNWDAEPPSVSFIDPFSEKKLKKKDIKIQFLQATDRSDLKSYIHHKDRNTLPPGSKAPVIDLLQGDSCPFFCIPGVKEYHDHAAHSGDSWMRHRTKGEGELCTLIDQLFANSIAQSFSYGTKLTVHKQPPLVISDIEISPNLNELDLSTDLNQVR